MRRHVKEIAGVLLWLAAALLVLAATGCATAIADRSVVYTEQGIETVEQAWNAEYRRRLASCASRFPAQTPEAEACFGPTYDADARVRTVIDAAVTTLRAYWIARQAGQSPDWRRTAVQVDALLRSLPRELQPHVDRIRGRVLGGLR